jgi:hypothetical protein
MSKKHRNWLERGERNKIILLGAGTKGGSGKSLKLANIFTWYQYKFGVVPKVWDCDSMQTLTRMIGAQSLFGVSDEIPLQWVLAEVLQDDEHSVFILDTAASSQSEVRKAFAKVDAEALYLDGVHIVLVASITKEEETVSKVLPWVDMLNASSSYLFVRNWVTEIEPRAVPIVQGESFAIEQGHYSPPELLQFIYDSQQPLHTAVFPYLRSFRRPFIDAKRKGSATALAEWNAIRDRLWADFPPRLRNGSIFMPAAMILDEFYNQLGEIADDLLPIEFQGRPPGSFPVSAGVGCGKRTEGQGLRLVTESKAEQVA